MELAINPSKIISTLCYSIFRLEPYTSCPFSCSYCYARWYRKESLGINPKVIGIFSKVAKKLDMRIAFRLATLSDPLQDLEEIAKVSLKLMRIAEENEVPIILNTKSDRISKSPWREQINRMAEDNLIVVQISISSLKNLEFEKKAPEAEKRLEALSSIEAPKIVRLQPFLPNYSFDKADEFVEKLKDYGVDQLTVEMLRIEKRELSIYGKYWDKWSNYSFEGSLIKAEAPEKLEELSNVCKKYGIDFALCKEGLFNLETANCCGFHYLEAEIRPTLREVYRELVRKKKIRFEELNEIFRNFLFGEKLNDLPRLVRKALKYHEKTLIRNLRKREVVERLTPLIKVDDEALILSKSAQNIQRENSNTV